MTASLFKKRKGTTAGELLGKDSTIYLIAREVANSDGIALFEIKKNLNLKNSTVRHHLRDKDDSLLKSGYVFENEGRYYPTKKLESLFYEINIKTLLLINFLLVVVINLIEQPYQVKSVLIGILAFLLVVFSRAK